MVAAASPPLVFRVPTRIVGLTRFITTSSLKASKYVFQLWKNVPESAKEVAGTVVKETVRFLEDGCMATSGNCCLWFEAANEAVDLLSVVSQRFDLTTEKILRETAQHVFGGNEEEGEVVTEPSADGNQPGKWRKVNEGTLTRFVFLLGHFALKLLQYSERVASNAKKARHKHEEDEMAQKKARQATKRSSSSSLLEDDGLGLVTQADDNEDEILERISNRGIVVEWERRREMMRSNLIGQFGHMLKTIITGKEGEYGKELVKVALLSFCKFMTISRSFCEANLNVRAIMLVKCSCCLRYSCGVRMSTFGATS